MNELKLGTITDLEGNILILKKLLKLFSKNKIDILILAGDIPSQKKNSLFNVLKKSLKLKTPILLIPGSHESFNDYDKPLRKLKNKLIIDGARKLKYNFNDYEFIFLPGSDYLARNGQYVLQQGIKNKKAHQKKRKMYSDWWLHKNFRYFDIFKVKKLIKNPKNAIIISHIPPKFNSKEAIDVAIFGTAFKNFSIKRPHLKLNFFKKLIKNKVLELVKNPKKGIIIKEIATKLIKYKYPVKLLKKNVGNKDILKLIKQKKINKLICGHIHEAGNKACNLKGKLIPENKFSEEFFLNSGQAEKGYACIVTLKDNLAKYKKVKV